MGSKSANESPRREANCKGDCAEQEMLVLRAFRIATICSVNQRLTEILNPLELEPSWLSRWDYVITGAVLAAPSRANVTRRLKAKMLTAAISQIAETASQDQAERTNAWYAKISAPTRRRHPAASSSKQMNISLVLNNRRIPENAGSTRWPMVKTIVARNPTVSA